MSGLLDERFKATPAIVSQSCTQTSTTNTAKDVVGSKVNVDVKPAAGTGYRITLAGTLTGGNAAHTVKLYLGSTAVMTLTADDVTALDWMAQFVIVFKDAKNQRVTGWMSSNGLDCENDYAAGTVDCTESKQLKCVITSGNSGDTVTSEVCMVEKWNLQLSTS